MAAERLRLPRLAHRCAAPSAPSAERRVLSAEREAAIRLAAGARARSARAIGAERVARGGAGWLRASGCPTPHTTAGRLLPASATIKKNGSPALALTELHVRCLSRLPLATSKF